MRISEDSRMQAEMPEDVSTTAEEHDLQAKIFLVGAILCLYFFWTLVSP